MTIYREKQPEKLVAAKQWRPKSATIDDPVALEFDELKQVQFGLLHTHDGQQLRVNDGDFVINHPADANGVQRWEVLSPEEFAAKYESVDPAADADRKGKRLPAKAGE